MTASSKVNGEENYFVDGEWRTIDELHIWFLTVNKEQAEAEQNYLDSRKALLDKKTAYYKALQAYNRTQAHRNRYVVVDDPPSVTIETFTVHKSEMEDDGEDYDTDEDERKIYEGVEKFVEKFPRGNETDAEYLERFSDYLINQKFTQGVIKRR